MPLNITADTPKGERKIADFQVSIARPYTVGHQLTEGEAAQLNQVLAENVSNNLRKRLGDGITEGEGESATQRPYTAEEAQALVDNYLNSYEPGVRQAGSGEPRVTDPVEREARRIAKEKVSALLKQSNMKQKDVDIGALVEAAYTQNKDALTAQAEKIVAARKKADAASDGIDLSNLLGTAAE